ncbi:pyruvate:ferredoxin (flavodoxin) oxidoreductase, partial [Enterococcus faecium]|nr:pyruvate:ferredoxin (flavodoxin) oxidoreductase [Enterococcus faecium]
YRYNPAMVEKNKNPMTLDYKKPDFSAMPDFMRKQVRFSSLENANPNLAKALFEKTIQDAKTRFYNYAALTGELEKIKKRLEPEESIDVPVKTRKEKTTDLEAEERRAARAERRKKMEQATKEKKEK